MKYSDDKIQGLNDFYQALEVKNRALLLKLIDLHQSLNNDEAKKFLMQGVGRRLKIVTRCLENVFVIFPPDREGMLSDEELSDVAINIHAYFINIAGLFDNLAWVFVYENELFGEHKEQKLNRFDVGLFNKKTLAKIKPELKDYLTQEPIASWYKTYSKGYRDALAHRVPLYVPPATLNEDETKIYKSIEDEINNLDLSNLNGLEKWGELLESQKQLGSISMFFAHSAADNGPAPLHAQLTCDYLTVEEVVEKFCIHF